MESTSTSPSPTRSASSASLGTTTGRTGAAELTGPWSPAIRLRAADPGMPSGRRAQFLLEAVILCNIGGVVGVLVGFGMGNLVALLLHFDVNVPMEWAAIGLLFCSAVGIGFGLLPAVRAARLNPIEALRYE